MRFLAGLFCLLMVGCATMESSHVLSIDPAIKPHFDVFLTEGRSRGRNLNIDHLVMKFVNYDEFSKGSVVIAQCHYALGDKAAIIMVDRDWWNWAAPETREQVIFHELGHCVLDRRGHIDDSVHYAGEIIPRSIMTTMLFSDYYYLKFRKYYIDELFAGSNHL